jgi:hypothetical protein
VNLAEIDSLFIDSAAPVLLHACRPEQIQPPCIKARDKIPIIWQAVLFNGFFPEQSVICCKRLSGESPERNLYIGIQVSFKVQVVRHN